MQPDGIFVKLAAGIQIHHVEDEVAAPDDVEWRIEDMLRHGHAMSLNAAATRLLSLLRDARAYASASSCSWMLLRFQLVPLSLICMSNDSANLIAAKTGSRWSDRTRKMCSPAFLRVARSRPSPRRECRRAERSLFLPQPCGPPRRPRPYRRADRGWLNIQG